MAKNRVAVQVASASAEEHQASSQAQPEKMQVAPAEEQQSKHVPTSRGNIDLRDLLPKRVPLNT